MFGDLMGMMGKLKETKEKIEATKKRLDTVYVQEKSSDGLLKLEMTANKKLVSLELDDVLLSDKEKLEDYLILHFNRITEKANAVQEAELGAVAKEGIPNIPGLESFLK